jgi:hypothetical protein
MRIMMGSAAVAAMVLACSTDDNDVTPSRETTSSTTGGAGNGGTGGGGHGGIAGAGGSEAGNGGAGGEEESHAGFVSGTRLRARYYLGDDGSKVFIGFYDNLLATDCFVTRAADGTRRCVPLSGVALTGYFGNAGCTQPAYIVSGACAPSAFAIIPIPPVACEEQRYEVRAVGALIGQAYGGTPTSCNPIPGFSAYTPGAESPPSQFVEMSEMVE